MASASADANVLTLLDYSLLSNQPDISEVAKSMIAAGSIMDDMPIITDMSLNHTGTRLLQLPAVNWRDNNADPAVNKVLPKPYQEAFYSFANQFQADAFVLMDKNRITNPIDFQVDAFLQAVVYETNDAFINNTHKTYPTRNRAANTGCFVGIRERLENADFQMATADLVATSAVTSAFSAPTAANTNILLREMASRLYSMGAPEGDGVTIYMAEEMIVALEAGVRSLASGGGWQNTTDAYGRSITKFKGARIRSAGRKAPTGVGATQAQVMTVTENVSGSTDTGGTYTSMYFVKWGVKSAFAWQFFPPKIQADAWLDNGVTKAVTVMGGFGLEFPSHRSIARLRGIQYT